MGPVVLAHGGAGSDVAHADGPERAVRLGLARIRAGASVLDAAVEACALLEDDPRFNAGTGSNLRLDGETIEMDAACMADDGRMGAVACIRDVRNPVLVARDVLHTPHNLLAGDGATRFARARGHAPHDPRTPDARARHARLADALRAAGWATGGAAWGLAELRASWNYEAPLERVLGPTDTVGVVASDGSRFAAALSTGGIMSTLLGRVGDVPLPGCGLWAGPHGAVALTGQGDLIARSVLALRVHGWLEAGATAEQARDRAIALFPQDVPVGILVCSRDGACGGANRDMAWAMAEDDD